VINNTISTPSACHLLIDVKNYYLVGTPMDRYEYMRLAINTLPDEIIQQSSSWTSSTRDTCMLKFVVVCMDYPKPESSPINS
jgi:hypothetical protein